MTLPAVTLLGNTQVVEPKLAAVQSPFDWTTEIAAQAGAGRRITKQSIRRTMIIG